jgi:hypothetical protein
MLLGSAQAKAASKTLMKSTLKLVFKIENESAKEHLASII